MIVISEQKLKKRLGDRFDGRRIRNLDSYHKFLPYLYPNRCDCEACFDETIDMTNALAYVREKNSGEYQYKTTMFQLFVAAFAKTCLLRPQLNRFIMGKRFYMRDCFNVGFVAKSEFKDEGGEFLVNMKVANEDTLTTLQEKLFNRIHKAKSGNEDDTTTGAMDFLCKLPRFLIAFVMRTFRFMEYFNIYPGALAEGDPNFTTVFVTNLGSIKCHSGYHHLNNWGTNSIFCSIGILHKERFYSEDATSYEIKDALDISLIVDERISDGFYFIRSIRLFKYLMNHPELLELPFSQEVEYE